MEPGISKQISSEGCSAFRVNERLTQSPMKFIEIEIYVRRNNDKLQSQKPSINYYNSVDAKQLNFFFFFFNMYGCPEEGKGIGSPGSGVTDGCEVPCESSLDLLEKQPVLLTAESFL